MSRPLAPGASVDHLRKEAKRWLKAIRAGDAAARERLVRVWPNAPSAPTLRDTQYALALEHGFAGWTALKQAAMDRQAGGSPRERALHALLRAADQGDVDALAQVLDSHPDLINERGTLEGHTGLRTALHFGVGSVAIVRTLLERGADPNIRDEGDNAFPLHFAVESGDLNIVKLLVEHGAATVAGEIDDHLLDIIGWATCFPNVETRPELVRYLLEHGATHTLHSAVAVGDTVAIRDRARENPAAIERPMDQVNRRRRALHLAVVKDQPRSVETLLELGADPNAMDAGGLTPLDEAALRGSMNIARTLLDRGARLTVAAAVALGRLDEAERLLEDDPDALKPGQRWGTLIVRAAADAPAHVIEALIRLGASPNVIDDPETAVDGTQGYTALHAAAWNGNVAAIDVLLKHGANPRARESRYQATPAGWASYARKQEALDRLLEADLDIFDAIDFGRADRIPDILAKDPAALHRPFGAYLPAGSLPTPWPPEAQATPLQWAGRSGKAQAVRVLGLRGAELSAGGHLARTHEDRVAAFLRLACLDWTAGGPGRAAQTQAAVRMLDRYPEIARESIYTAVVCGDAQNVRRLLMERPELARASGGPRDWPPLLYLCSARLPGYAPTADNAVAIARMLLERGASPDAFYFGGNEDIHYTALTCVIGRGEEQAVTHPRARELAALLLEAGAEPYDKQVLYNGFAGHASHRYLADDDLVWLLQLIYDESLKRGRHADWADPDWQMLEMGGYGGGAWYLLHNALKGNYLTIAEWALAHGANPNPPRGTDSRIPMATLYELAAGAGLFEFAELLVRYGAPRRTAPAEDTAADFAAACFRLDRERARQLAEAHPQYLTDPNPVMRAAEQDRADVAALLMDLGMSPDIQDGNGTRPLHLAAYEESPAVVGLLVERGAEIDPRDNVHHATPIYWAYWGGRPRMVDLLAPLSGDVWTLVPTGRIERLRELLGSEPRLARSSWEGGTPLFALPEDEEVAAEIVRLFLANGADASFALNDGTTAERVARARGLDAAAELLARARKA